MLLFQAIETAGWFREDLFADRIILLFIFIPILRTELFDWVDDHNALPIRPQHERSQHVAGVPNNLYRGSVDAVKQGFDLDLDLHTKLEATVLAYGRCPIYSQSVADSLNLYQIQTSTCLPRLYSGAKYS
jgi:hypothetical protein